ncbi:MAG: hypothetical protein ACR2MQ_11960 [Gemmatimonadaceae bacterium]
MSTERREPYLLEVALRRERVPDFGRYPRDFLNRYPAMLRVLMAADDEDDDD